MYKVTIIVPCYNTSAFLSMCLKSILRQTLKELEIICIDDGSTDNTLNILKKFEEKDKRIRVISKNNSGYGDTINLGLKEAQGEYIGIVEPDDYIDNDMYESLYNVAKTYKIDIVKSDYYQWNDISNHQIIVKNFGNDKFYNKILNPQFNKILFRFTTSNWTGIYSNYNLIKPNLISHNTTKGASYQDTGFRFLCFCNAKSVYYLKKSFYHYRQTNASSSSNNKGNIYAIEKEYDFIKEKLISKNLFQEFKDVYSLQRFDGFKWNLHRIDQSFKQEYVDFCSVYYNKMYLEKELNLSLFNPFEKYQFNLLICKPKLYIFNARIPLMIIIKLCIWNYKTYGLNYALKECLTYPKLFMNKLLYKFKNNKQQRKK